MYPLWMKRLSVSKICQNLSQKKKNIEEPESLGAEELWCLPLQLSLALHRKVRHLGRDSTGLRGVSSALGRKMKS